MRLLQQIVLIRSIEEDIRVVTIHRSTFEPAKTHYYSQFLNYVLLLQSKWCLFSEGWIGYVRARLQWEPIVF